jgi:hypothetical protein
VRLGVGKKEKVIITVFKAIRITTIKDTSQKSAIIAETISGNSTILPPLVILASKTI